MIDLALDGRVMLYSELDEAVQELDLIFNTENTELLGYKDFGTSFEQFSWQLSPNVDSLKQYIDDKINSTMYLSNFKHNVDVECDKGEYRLIYYVKITVYDKDNNEITRKYEFR